MLRDKLGRQLRGKASGREALRGTNYPSVSGQHHACAHIRVQYEIFTSSAPDTGFIFVEAKSPRGPASVKVSTQQNTGRLVGSGLETEECDRD